MPNTSSFARRALLAVTMGTLAATATPVVAAPPRVAKITVPAAVFKDASSKLCMPRSTSPMVGKDKSLPETLCQTRDQWAEHGVLITTK